MKKTDHPLNEPAQQLFCKKTNLLQQLSQQNLDRRAKRFESQKIFWQVFNAMARVAGVGFTIVGGIFALWGLSLLLDSKATIDVDGVPTTDPWEKALLLIVGLVVCALGILTFLARRYRPDLGDSAFTTSKKASKDEGEK